MEIVCRTCLHLIGPNYPVTPLNQPEHPSDSVSLRQKLLACVPELTVDIVHDPVICCTCSAAVALAYQFRSTCLETEKTLYKSIQSRQHNPYDLLNNFDLVTIARKDINEEHSYSFVERCSSNETVEDMDSDDDGSLAKLPTSVQSSLTEFAKHAGVENKVTIIEDTEETEKSTVRTKKQERKRTPRQVKRRSLSETDKSYTTPVKQDKLKKEMSIPEADDKSNLRSPKMTAISPKTSKKFEIATNSKSLSKTEGSDVPIRRNLGYHIDAIPPAIVAKEPELKENGFIEISEIVAAKEKIKPIKQETVKKNYPDNIKMEDCATITKPPRMSAKLRSKSASPLKQKKNKKRSTTPSQNESKAESPKKLIKREIHKSFKNSPSKDDYNVNNDPSNSEYNPELMSPQDINRTILGLPSCSDNSMTHEMAQINQLILKSDLLENASKLWYNNANANKRYRCTKCAKGYNFKSHFDVHLKSHIFKKLFACPICEKTFAQEKYLKAHAVLHTNSGLFQCEVCFKSLSASTALKRHLRTHSGERPYSCTCCQKRFSQKIQLAVHMRTHTGLRPFACNICSASFTQKSHLLGHIRTHTGEKPFKCDQCPKCFRKTYALQIHKHSHSVKPFQCKACNFLFKDSDVFQRHVNKHLMNLTTNTRIVKKPKTKRKILDELEQDVRDIHMGVQLSEQRKNASEKTGGKRRVLFGVHACSVCNRTFTTKFSMKRHMIVHAKEQTVTQTLLD